MIVVYILEHLVQSYCIWRGAELLFAVLSITTHNNIKFDNNITLFVFDQWES